MLAYLELSGFPEQFYRQQAFRFIPILDRVYLRDFYDRQNEDMEKHRRQNETSARKSSR